LKKKGEAPRSKLKLILIGLLSLRPIHLHLIHCPLSIRFREEDTAKDDWDEEFGGDFYEALSRKTSTNSISACSPDVRKLLDRQRRLSLKDNDTLEPILVSLGDVSAAELEQLLLPHGDSKMVFDPVLSRWVGEEVDMSGFEWEEDGEVCEEGEKTVDME
ncbi:unnamed protein product, partial [Chrysoparadoxa australica]